VKKESERRVPERGMLEVALIAIGLAYAFTFTNGFQDTGALAATFIASRSATPRRGILFVTALEFLGALLGGSAVAFTLASLLTVESPLLIQVLLVALLGATSWNLVAWRYAVPSSSTHALIGGLVGSALVAGGAGSIRWGIEELLLPPHALVGFMKILAFLSFSLVLGFFGGYLLHACLQLLLRNAKRALGIQILRCNWAAAGLMAFGNGANDGQKLMGVLAVIALGTGLSTSLDISPWIRGSVAIFLTAGALAGGWRIMTTLGRKVFKIRPVHSFSSQVSSGIAILVSTLLGAPISSTHIISSSVIGVGTAENPRKVQWSVGKEVVLAMVFTLPGTLLLTAGLYTIARLFVGG
jgi:PiT family inorganic phosphate transporter